MGLPNKKMKYGNFKEWLKDFSIYEKNPDDSKFAKAMEIRTRNSSDALKDEVREFLESRAMAYSPEAALEVIDRVMREAPKETWLVIKSQQDPWFVV